MRKKKTFIRMALCLSLFVGNVSSQGTVFASSEAAKTQVETQIKVQAQEVSTEKPESESEFKCGKSATWNYDESTKTLMVKGTGSVS